jgi:hypothetical protein
MCWKPARPAAEIAADRDILRHDPDKPPRVLQIPGGTGILGVHASPRADDGPGIEPAITDELVAAICQGSTAECRQRVALPEPFLPDP